MPDVFLSYKREDLTTATRLVEGLRAAGLDVWWDSDIPPDAPWEATIERALAEAMVVLVCWSKAAVASENVRSEARWAREQGRLIQAFVQPCDPPLFFGERQGVDLSGWSGDAADARFGRLVAAIHARLQRTAPDLLPSPRPSETVATVLARASSRRLAWIGAVVVLLLAIAGGGTWLALGPPGHSVRGQHIAVLPFEAISPDPAARYFGEAVSDHILANLSRRQIPTVSRDDALGLRGPGKEAQVRNLDVGLLFDGTVQGDGQHITADVHLDDPRAHATLWSASFTGDAAKPDELQGQVAARVGAVLYAAGRALRPTGGLSDPTVLGLYLHACDLFQSRGEENNPVVIYELLSTLRQVIAEAPDFAPARSDLAKFEAYYVTDYYASGLPPEQAPQFLGEAREQASRALALDPKDADAYVALSLTVPMPGWLERERLLHKALEVDPEWPHANGFLGEMLWEVGRLNEAAEYLGRAAAANPLSPEFGWTTVHAQALAAIGQAMQADQAVAELQKLWPTDTDVWNTRYWVAWMERRWKDAEAVMDDPSGRPPGIQARDLEDSRIYFRAAETGSPADVAAARKSLLANLADGRTPTGLTVLYLGSLGLVDDAFSVAAALPNARPTSNKYVALFSPGAAAMRRDPRIIPLAAKLGLVDYWRTTGKWPDFCSEPGLPYDCKAEAAKLAAPPRKT